MNRHELDKFLHHLLQPELVKDFCPNGLQVEGSKEIKKIVTGVTATKELIEYAIKSKADTILVHHGYFWKSENQSITGMKYQRIKKLIENNINLFAYHLPLDVHPTLGNNAQLAKLLGIKILGSLELATPEGVVMYGEFENEMLASELTTQVSQKLSRKCLHIAPASDKKIKTLAWCTGGGQNYIELAASRGIDCFITGEASEQTTHIAREMNIHFIAAGHHATERYGVKALGEHIATETDITVEFIDIDNPV